ncbi:MAG: FHA domain-containing protein [Acidobacteriia bacterium]|nr:FHA domain-containing protein [Terriglobia bacterium]
MEAALIGPNGRTTLGTMPLTIGRLPGNQLQITDSQASSRHAEIRSDDSGQGYSIVDLGSTNGTFVNEQRLSSNIPRLLKSGDTIRIGETFFTYEAIGAAGIAPTFYVGSDNQNNAPGFQPTVAAPQPYTDYNAQQGYAPPAPPPPSAYQPPPTYQASSYTPPAQPGFVPPPPGGYPPPVAPVQQQAKSRRSLWLILGISAGVLVLLCACVGVFVSLNRSTPEKTLTTYCADLKSGDYHDAYQQFSSSFQAQETEAKFTASLSQAFTSAGGLKDCTFGNVTTSGSTSQALVTWIVNSAPTTPINFNDTRLINENGTWKIEFSRSTSQTS